MAPVLIACALIALFALGVWVVRAGDARKHEPEAEHDDDAED